MSRNTVDFDDLLASLDDLTSAAPPPEEHHHHHEEHHDHGDHHDHGGHHHDHHEHHDHGGHHHDHHDDFRPQDEEEVDVLEELSFGGGGPPPPPPPAPFAAPPPPAPVFKAKAVAATPFKPKQAPTPVVSKPAPRPVQPQQPSHQQPSHHNNSGSSPSGGDLRNYARQTQVVTPSRGGSSNDSCHKCGQKFDGEYVTAQGKAFHRNHFSCHECGSQLDQSFYDHHGNTICEKCAGNLLPCTKCHRGITGQYVIQDGKPHHKECVEKWVCAKCHRDVEDVVTSALGKHWHKHCFVCQKCSVQLGGSFVNENGFPTCQNCATKGLPKCHVCSRELVGDYTQFDGRGYHNECFKCQRCQTKLQLSGFYNVGGQHVCERCANAR